VKIAANQRHAGPAGDAAALQAKLMLGVLCLIWGTTWPLMKIALNEIPPLSMRTATTGMVAAALLLTCVLQGRSLSIPNARTWGHVVASALLNIVAFSVFNAFAQIEAATSRVAILTYTMPIWAALLAWAVLGQRPSRAQKIAVVLCVAGIGILISPLLRSGMPRGLFLALASGLSWATGTVYLKWARINGDPIGVAAWQLVIAFVVITVCMLVFEGRFDVGGLDAKGLFALTFTGLLGNGAAYLLWFSIVHRLPAATAALGMLGSPVIGILATIIVLGERPSGADIIGFVLIFAASACALLFAPAASPAPAELKP
jgi:drug/metabolite transporter (DMT)-like permease